MFRVVAVLGVVYWTVANVDGFVRYNRPPDSRFKPPTSDGAAATFISTIREYIRQYPSVLQRIDALAADLESGDNRYYDDDAWECPNQGPDVCLFSSLGLSSEGDDDVMKPAFNDALHHAIGTVQEDPDDCAPCMDLLSVLQTVSCNRLVTWEMIRDLLIPLCEELFESGGMDPTPCNGSITLHGKHVYCILQETDVRDWCESLNNCYPPDQRVRLPVSERTPWAVKESRENGHAVPDTQATRPAKDRLTDGLLMVGVLTDIHVQFDHLVGSKSECLSFVCCLDDSIGTGSAREYGEYNCNLPPRTLDLFLERVAEAHPDFVIYPGDSPPHNLWEETMTSQLNNSQLIVDAMSRSFPEGTRVYPNIGNHEMFPTNLFSLRMDETLFMKDVFVKMWHKLAGFDDSANGTFGELGYYTTTVPGHPKLRIVSVNSNYDWYAQNFYNTLNQYSDENEQHKQWINDTLADASLAGEKVILISHHPIGGDTHVRASRWWEEVVNTYGDVISLHVSGHTHQDHFMLSFDPDTMDAVSVNTIVASASPRTDINPTMRMFYLDPEDYSLVDFESFYLDIKTQEESRAVPPAVAFSYSALDEYQLPDMSPNSWKDLILRFIDDDTLFQKFYKNRYSQARDQYCDYDCKVGQICSIWFPAVDEAAECRTLAPPEPTTTTTTTRPPITETSGAYNLAYNLGLTSVCLLMSNSFLKTCL